MPYTQLNENIDEQIRQLQARTAYDENAQMQINDLLHQKSINEQQMMQPMSAAEYDEYDDNGQYIGNQAQIPMQTQPSAGFGQTLVDGVNHTAQGISLGWSD